MNELSALNSDANVTNSYNARARLNAFSGLDYAHSSEMMAQYTAVPISSARAYFTIQWLMENEKLHSLCMYAGWSTAVVYMIVHLDKIYASLQLLPLLSAIIRTCSS